MRVEGILLNSFMLQAVIDRSVVEVHLESADVTVFDPDRPPGDTVCRCLLAEYAAEHPEEVSVIVQAIQSVTQKWQELLGEPSEASADLTGALIRVSDSDCAVSRGTVLAVAYKKTSEVSYWDTSTSFHGVVPFQVLEEEHPEIMELLKAAAPLLRDKWLRVLGGSDDRQ